MSGLSGINGVPGTNGQDYPNSGVLRRNNYGIQSQLSRMFPPPPYNCRSCPPGLPGVPGAPGIKMFFIFKTFF